MISFTVAAREDKGFMGESFVFAEWQTFNTSEATFDLDSYK